MSSFAAFLHVQGVRYPLLTYSLTIHQETDSLGRPASPTQGGTIDCTLSAPDSDRSGLLQWMFSPTTQLDGQVLLMQDTPRATLKTISFFNAYCVGLQTTFQPGMGGGGSLQMQLRISPQRVAVGAIVHDNNWPVESHGAGERHGKQERQVQKQKSITTGEEAFPYLFVEVTPLSEVVSEKVTDTDISHYTPKEDVDITDDMKSKIDSVANSYYEKTKKDLVITDGKRKPDDQADAMFKKLEKGEDLLKLYSNDDAVTEIVNSYDEGKANKDSDSKIKEDMTAVIQKQVDDGTLISRHMSDKAFDVRSRTMNDQEVENFKKSVEENGGSTIVEGDHLHVQFSD